MSEDKDELTDLTTGSPEEENDAHSNYQPETSPHDSITHHLSGMYQNWFLDRSEEHTSELQSPC